MEEVEQKVFKLISSKKLTIPLLVLFILFISTCAAVIYLAAASAFRKFDDSTEYNIDVKSEVFEYNISAQTSPHVLLQRFIPLVTNCKSMQVGQSYENATIAFKKNVQVLIERKSNSRLKLSAATVSNNGSQVIGTLINKFERCKLERSAVFEINLDENNPIFSMHVVGDLRVGKILSDAVDDYFPLVTSGQIIIQDKTTFSKTNLYLTPQSVRPGDTLLLTSAKGIIRASHEESALTGVFSQSGNDVLLQHLYADKVEAISPSFIDRVSSDSELAFALSIGIVFIQFIGFGISTTFRLAMFSGSVPRSGKRRFVGRRKNNNEEN